jgi:hypothetical protein
MNIEYPSNWGKEPVSEFLKFAYSNNVSFFKHFSKMPAVKAIREVDKLFLCFAEIHFNIKDYMLPNFVTRCRAAYLGAVRLATSGQVVEAYMVMRVCLENALYALHIYEDTEYVTIEDNHSKAGNNDKSGKAKKRLLVWSGRGKNADANDQCRKVFSHSKAIKSLDRKNKKLGEVVSTLYNRTIDNGAHPNFYGMASTCNFNLDDGEDQYFLPPDSVPFKLCVQTIVEVGVCSLFIFYLMFKEYFTNNEFRKRLYELIKLFPKDMKALNNSVIFNE